MSKVFTSIVYGSGDIADPSAGGGVPAAIGSIYLRQGTTQLWQKFGALDTDWQLFVASGAPGTCLIYKPGSGLAGPIIFDTWAGLMTELANLRTAGNGGGCYTIQFDDSITSPAAIPMAAGPYDMSDVTWAGTSVRVAVSIDDGATFTGLRRFVGPLNITNNNTVTPPVADLVDHELVIVNQTWLSTVAGGVPFFDASGLAGGEDVTFYLSEHSAIGPVDTGTVFSFPTAGTTLFYSQDDSSFIVDPTTFSGGAAATLEQQYDSLQLTPAVFTNWAGTVSDPNLAVPPSLLPRPYLAAAANASFTSGFGQWLRFDASGAPIAETLPPISTAANNFRGPGCFVLASETGGGTLTLAPTGGDTIQGSAAAITVPPNGTTMLISDGVSDWTIVTTFTSGGTSSGASSCLIYQPGGTGTGPGTFSSWSALMTRLAALRAAANGGGCYTIQFDDSITSPAVIPAGGPYDMTNVTWEGDTSGFGASVTLAAGSSFTGLRSFSGALNILNNNTVAPAVTDLATGDIVTIRQATLETVTGGQPFFQVTGASFVIVEMFESAALGVSQTGAVFSFVTAGSTLFLVKEGVSSIAIRQSLVGVAGATLSIATSSLQSLETVFTNWAGTVSAPRLDVPPSLLPVPYLGTPGTTNYTAGASQWGRFTTAGGSITQSLPKISTATNTFSGPGCLYLASESSGTNTLSIIPTGGDTINGSASTISCPAGGAMLFISDGVSNWTIVAQFGNRRFSPPEQWVQNDVAASQTNVALSAQVSTNFDTIKMMRAGSIVGLSTRLTEACTAGTLTVTVTKNGAAGTLAVVTTNASNTTGGQSTQRTGIDTFVAGDLIGVQLTSSAGWLPITSDLESWIEIEEAL